MAFYHVAIFGLQLLSSMSKPTKALPPKPLKRQPALENIRPAVIRETQPFRWTKEPESGSRVEFDLGDVAEGEVSTAVVTRKYVFAQ